jgi:hypothetical protein
MSRSVALTEPERRKLNDLESIIEKGLTTFVEVGAALAMIREQKLYSSSTFEEYCWQRWGWARKRSEQLIRASDVVQSLDTTVSTLPTNEAQARELAPVPADKRTEVWTKAVEESGGKPKAKHVRKAAAPYKPKKLRKPGPKEAADRAQREADTPAATPSPDPAQGIGNSHRGEVGGEPDAYVERADARTGSPRGQRSLSVTPDVPALTETGRPSSDEGSAGEALQAEREDALVPASPTLGPAEVEGASLESLGETAPPPSVGLAGFTPGPWCVWEGPLYEGGGADLCIGAGETWLANMDHRMPRCPQILDGGHKSDECDICTIDAHGITDEQRANARLISAAPDMYEVLATIENDAGQVPSWLWDQIQAALAKATGNATERGVT